MEKNGGSRLLQMQARFQQKQLQEREMKIASLYEAQQARALGRVRHSPSNGIGTASPPSPPPTGSPVVHQPGKVRQMFEERRTKAGIDKSYPLQPIHNTGARKPLPNGYTKVTTASSRVAVERKSKTVITNSSTHSLKKQNGHKLEHIVNGSGDLNHNHETDINNLKQTVIESNGELTNGDEVDKDNNYLLENETFPEAMAPIPTPRSPEHQTEVKKTVRKSPAVKSSPAKSTKPQPHASTPPRKVISNDAVAEKSKSRVVMQKTSNPPARRTPTVSTNKPRPVAATGSVGAEIGGGGGGGEPCSVCGRRFAPDRLDKHQAICAKAHAKKRKPFDALKHRIAGTEAEQFVSKGGRKGAGAASSTKVNKSLNNNWRQKHEEFINAIRAAKQVQAHLNAGGKLSDLPPPPPSENPDYVQCPHCNRKFNQGAAERHIPKCANYQFNKPKPTASRRR